MTYSALLTARTPFTSWQLRAEAELERRGRKTTERAVPWTHYAPHQPTEKQTAFLDLDCLEAFYGGAAGGGKSDALLMAALRYVDMPGYAALLLRRTYEDLSLPEALMDRAQSWLGGTDARWHQQGKTWTFPSGATLTFGYLQHENDKYRYQSAAFQYIGFDELTQFTETQYRYLFSRLRRLKGSNIPLRMRAASNPGGIGHEWVKQRFLVEGQETGRVFIPAKLPDNPHIDQTEYIASLSQLDPVTRQQLLDGDWTARAEGNKFRREWFKIVDAAPADLPRRVRYWDLAATEAKPGKDPDWTVGALVGVDNQGVSWVLDVRRMRGTPAEVEALVKQTAQLDGRAVDIWIEQEPGAAGKSLIDYYQRQVLRGLGAVRGDKVTGNKEVRANPASAYAEAGNIRLVRGAWIGEFLDELEVFPNGAHDDQVDAFSGGFEKCMQVGRAKVMTVEMRR